MLRDGKGEEDGVSCPGRAAAAYWEDTHLNNPLRIRILL